MQKLLLKPLAVSVTRQLAKKMAVTSWKTQGKQMFVSHALKTLQNR